MLTQRTRGLINAAAFLAASGAIALAPSAASAKTKGSVVIDRVESVKTAAGREVVIHASSTPTFSVFRLSEPFRILVDVNDARTARPIDLMKIRDGVLRYVSTNHFADEASSILRVEIALEGSHEYTVDTQGKTIRVRIKAPGGAVVAPTPKAAAVQPKKASPSPAAATAAPTTKAIAQLGKFFKRKKGKRALITASLRGKISESDVHVEQLENPSRLVIDVAGAKTTPKWQRLKVRQLGIERARIGTNEAGVRIVLDASKRAKRLPKVDVSMKRGNLRIALSRAPKAVKAVAKIEPVQQPAPAPVVKKATPKPVVEEVAAAPAAPTKAAKRSVKKAQITDVTFEPKDGFLRLTVFLDGKAEVAKTKIAGSGVPALRLTGAKLPKSLERTLDVSQVAVDVMTSISSYQQDGDTIITAAIGQNTEHRHWQNGNRLMWDFRSTEPATTAQINYPERATSGYASNAAKAIGKLAPKRKRYRGRRISLDLKDAEIKNVLRLLADVSKLNIVAADDVNGRVTIKLRNVPWDQALDIILRSKQLDKTRNGNIIRVAPIEVLRKEEELRIERAKARIELEPLSVRLIPVSYAVASEIQPQVAALLSARGKVNIDGRTNVLIVEDIGENLVKVERLVRTLDTQTPQVLIEARIVEARANFSRDLGIQWGGTVNATSQYGTQTGLNFPSNIRLSGGADDGQNNVSEGVLSNPNYAVNLPAAVGAGVGGGLGMTFGSIGGAALLSVRLSAAESTGKIKIISSPKIVTIDNKEAKILSGERVPITVVTANGPTTRFINANIELNVTPHVTQDGSVLLQIDAKKNELSDRVDALGTPGIITKEAATEMIVADGDTAVLGGLYRRTTTENKSYVPWLGKIPVLGWLFKSTSRSDARDELLIFISPRIVNRSSALVSPT